MGLTLPADVEPFLTDGVEWSDPGCYALTLNRPDDLAQAWDDAFETRPPYFEELRDANGVAYVGAAQDVMHRLEDHVQGEKRKAALLRVCDIDKLLHVEWTNTPFQDEYNVGVAMSRQYPDWYIHQR